MLELLLAGIRACIAAARPGIRRAVEAVLVNVQLERVVAPVAVLVVAADKGQLDATDGLARSIAVLGVSGLRADVGGRRRALTGLRRGGREHGCRAGRAGNDGGGRLERADSLAGVAAPELALGALAVLARGAAVLVNVATPQGEVEALENIREASMGETGSDTRGASGVGLGAVLFVRPVRQRRAAPVTALVLARSRNRDGGCAHGTSGRRCVMMAML